MYVDDLIIIKFMLKAFWLLIEEINISEYTKEFSGDGGKDARMLEKFHKYFRDDKAMSSTFKMLETSI